MGGMKNVIAREKRNKCVNDKYNPAQPVAAVVLVMVRITGERSRGSDKEGGATKRNTSAVYLGAFLQWRRHLQPKQQWGGRH